MFSLILPPFQSHSPIFVSSVRPGKCFFEIVINYISTDSRVHYTSLILPSDQLKQENHIAVEYDKFSIFSYLEKFSSPFQDIFTFGLRIQYIYQDTIHQAKWATGQLNPIFPRHVAYPSSSLIYQIPAEPSIS